MEIENLYRSFNRIFLSTSIFVVLLIFTISRLNIGDNTREQLELLATLMPLTVALFSMMFMFRDIPNPKIDDRIDLIIGFLATIAICFFTSILQPFGSIPNGWSGFGIIISTGSCVAALVIIGIKRNNFVQLLDVSVLKRIKSFFLVSSTLIVVLYLPSLIQPPFGFINFGDSTYHVLEETLAQSSGFIPYVNYTPSYTSLFGWPIKIAQLVGFHGGQLLWLSTIEINLVIWLTLVQLARTLRKLTPRVPMTFILMSLLSALLISGSNNAEYSIISNLSVIPGRILFPSAIFVLLLKLINEPSNNRNRVMLGVVIGLGMTEPPGISVVAGLIAVLILLSLVLRSAEFRASLITVCFTILATLAAYVGLLQMVYGRFDFTRYLMMLRAVSKSQNSQNYLINMPAFGFHVVVFGCLMSSTTLGFRFLLRSLNCDSNTRDPRLVGGSLCATFFGLLGLIWSIQFAKASLYPFVLQFLFFLTILSIWGLISVSDLKDQSLGIGNKKRIIEYIIYLPLLVVSTIPLIAVTQMPNPITGLNRIFGSQSVIYDRWTEVDLESNPRGKAIQSIIDQFSESKIGYFGILGNSTETIFGVQNYLGVTAPEHLNFNATSQRLGCAPLLENPPQILIVAWSTFPCPGFSLVETSALGNSSIQQNGIYVYAKNP